MLLIFKVSFRECDEGAQKKWEQQEDLQDFKENREEARLQGNSVKSSHCERKDGVDDNFLEGEEENGLTLNEKNFFPEYNCNWRE